MILVVGNDIGNVINDDGKTVAKIYDEVEVIDDVHKHKFIFTQTKDNGVQIKMIPYDGDLK